MNRKKREIFTVLKNNLRKNRALKLKFRLWPSIAAVYGRLWIKTKIGFPIDGTQTTFKIFKHAELHGNELSFQIPIYTCMQLSFETV